MAEIVQGTVVSLIAGYYDVQTPAGVVRTRARGVFRKNREKPQVGDSVQVKLDEQGLAYLVKILPRTSSLLGGTMQLVVKRMGPWKETNSSSCFHHALP